jgi:polysaccharide deacetylase 2 family uncharacterized protein YibQ
LVKKTAQEKKQNGARTRHPPARKKKPVKKLKLRDKVIAAAAAGILVAIAVTGSLALIHFRTKDADERIAAGPGTVQQPAPVEKPPAPPLPVEKEPAEIPSEEPAAARPEPDKKQAIEPAAVTPAPAERRPVETVRPAPVEKQPVKPAPAEQSPHKPAPAVEKTPAVQPAALPLVLERPPERPSRGKLGFLIDDAGNNLGELDPFLNFPGPLTIAVLPGLPNSVEAARRIRAAGKEVFLHQPMEALGGRNPGPGAVYAGMGAAEIRAIVNKNLDEIWPVAGMNNHEGSRVTMDEAAMETILGICRERGILFVDSRTTAETAAPAAARKLGIVIGERDVFLDNEQDRNSILGYIGTGLRKAEQKGSAVMIGHTWSPALAPLLYELYADWLKEGYTLSTVSALAGVGR